MLLKEQSRSPGAPWLCSPQLRDVSRSLRLDLDACWQWQAAGQLSISRDCPGVQKQLHTAASRRWLTRGKEKEGC